MAEQISPSITFMLQYTEANAQYVDYTNRDEAVEVENELALDKQSFEELTREQINSIQQSIPEQNLNFRDYIDYMNRSYATESQDRDITAVFNQESNYLQRTRVEQLKKNLETAYQNGSLLWQGVVSFDNNWLAQEGLIDKNTGQVNQQAIKNAIREMMPKMIQKEGLSDTAFWWGNIHLNTDNVHVHIGLSELESNREKIYYKPRRRWEYKGNFSQKTMKQVKSAVYHGLANQETRSMMLRKEQLLANLRTDLLANVFKNNQVTVSAEKNFLEQAYNHLPQEKKWRYGSNARDFAVSKFFINRYLDSYFANDGKEYYQQFLTETREFLASYEGVYSAEKNQAYEKLRYVNGKAIKQQVHSSGYDIEKLIQRREEELRERLGNQILKKFMEEVPRIANPESKNNLSDFSVGNQKRIREQLSDATYVHLADAWEKMGYKIPDDASPIYILKPVYDEDENGMKSETPRFVKTEAFDISQVQEDILNKRLNLKQLSLLSSDELKALVDAAKNKENRSEREQKELGTFRYALRLSLLAEKQAELMIQKELLDKVQPLESDKLFVSFKKSEVTERLEYIELQMTPNFKLKKLELAKKEAYSQKYEDSVQLSVKKADRGYLRAPLSRLTTEMNAVATVQDEKLLSLLKGRPMTKESYLEELKTHVSIFQVKNRIFENNELIARDPGEEQAKVLKRSNAYHFSELKQLYQKLLPEGESEKQSQIAQAVSKTMQRQRQLKKSGLQQEQGKLNVGHDFMKGLSMTLRGTERSDMRAFMAKLRADERAEREEQSQSI